MTDLSQAGSRERPVRAVPGFAARTTAVAAHLAAAVVLGIYADLGFNLSGGWEEAPLMATPWLVLAFSAARVPRGAILAVVAGLAVVEVGLVSYYGWLVLAESVDPDTVVRHYDAALWITAGAAVGTGFGVVGLLSRSNRATARLLAWSSALSIPVVDLIRMAARDEGQSTVVAAALVAAGVGLWLWAQRSGRVGSWTLLIGTAAMTLVLWQGQILVLRHLFGKNL